MDYAVERLRDGRRYASRRVRASQDGRTIFEMLAAFHDAEDGPAHSFGQAPASPSPDTLPPLIDVVRAQADRLPAHWLEHHSKPFPVEIRLIDAGATLFEQLDTPRRSYWFRIPTAAGIEAPHDREALLAFMSDFWFAGTAAAMHSPPGTGRLTVVTLNHHLWFHAPADPGDWLMHETESPFAGQGRGLIRGTIWDRAGRQVATTAQEISIRPLGD